jgi:DNA-binding protein YbaB
MIPEGDMSGLLAQAQAMQEQFLNAQQELADMQIEGSAGSGWSPRQSPAPTSCWGW